MKTIRFTAFSILFGLLVLATACKKETTQAVATQSGNKILVTGQDAGIGLKSNLSGQTTVWKGSDNYSVSPNVPDQVGIYSAEARTASGGGSTIVNAPFTATTSAASSAFSGTMYWGAPSTSHTFYAYYPYSASAGSNATAIPVSLATAQTQSTAGSSAHIGALDFMVATPKTETSPTGSGLVGSGVNLSYNHLFTVLEFHISDTGSPAGTLKAVKLVGTSNPVAFSDGTINLNQTPATDASYTFASQTGTTTQAIVTLGSAATLTTNPDATIVYMVINPGTQTGDCLIGLSADGTTWACVSKAAPAGGFLRGKKYVVSVDQAETSSVSIGDSYQGGIVFYILKDGDTGYNPLVTHGLIAATVDQGTSAWITGSASGVINGNTSSDLGKGQANTNYMMNQSGYTGGAAQVCNDYSITVNSVIYDDWYLPSKDELNKLYLQRVAVGGFSDTMYYRSSTEDAYWSAMVQLFDSDGTQTANNKNNYCYVRAIRSF